MRVADLLRLHECGEFPPSMGFEKWTETGSENWTLLGLQTVFSEELGGKGSAGLPRSE